MSEDRHKPDRAAVLGGAVSLWTQCRRVAGVAGADLSECYNGMDELMRVVLRIAERFEEWSCQHVAFSELNDVWPYLLEDRFGAVCVDAMGVENLSAFDECDCLRIALRLHLPIKPRDGLPLPVDVSGANPVAGSDFVSFRIRTMRYRNEDDGPEPFSRSDEPYDEECGPLFCSLFGIDGEGRPEHIADRPTLADVLRLVRNLAPGISFDGGAG